MSRLLFVLLLILAAFFTGCSNDPIGDARARLSGVNVAALRLDAAKIYKQLHAAPGPEFIALMPKKWPDSFKKLSPLRVGVYRDGFAFALGGEADSEWGLHVFPTGMNQVRATGSGRFEKLADGVFWYSLRN